MFNCYVVIWNNEPFAFMRTEQAAENLVRMFAQNNHPAPVMTIEGRFVPDIGF